MQRWRWLVVLGAGCAGHAWKPVVVTAPPDRPVAEIAYPFHDGQNGTELVLAVLAQAKAMEVETLSGFAIRVGGCTRAVSADADLGTAAAGTELDRIVFRARETQLVCRKRVEQTIEHGGPDGNGKMGFGDPVLVVRQSCEPRPVDHVVIRYRHEIDHGFIPPDWDEVERQTGVRLALGPPHCGDVAGNEVRVQFHRDAATHVEPVRSHRAGDVARDSVIRLAREASGAQRPTEAARLADRALAAIPVDEDVDPELADAIACAHFFAIEREVDAFLGRAPPAVIDAQWASETGKQLDAIARHYEQLRDRVRLPSVATWLRKGAARLGTLHLHVARILDDSGQAEAAKHARDQARALDEMSRPGPTRSR
jgi:hypothetical protein